MGTDIVTENADRDGAIIGDCNFDCSNIEGGSLDGSDIVRGKLDGSNIKESGLNGTGISEVWLDDTGIVNGNGCNVFTDIKGDTLEGSNLEGSNRYGDGTPAENNGLDEDNPEVIEDAADADKGGDGKDLGERLL